MVTKDSNPHAGVLDRPDGEQAENSPAGPDEREAEIRARAEAILAIVPTKEELAEIAERRHRNAVDRIMTRRAPEPLHYRVTETPRPDKAAADVTAADSIELAGRKAEIEAKAASGERLSERERKEWWFCYGFELIDEIDALLSSKSKSGVNADAIGNAFTRLIAELAAVSVAHTTKRLALEDRVAALEAASRPRRNRKGNRYDPS